MLRFLLAINVLWIFLGFYDSVSHSQVADKHRDTLNTLHRGRIAYERKDYATALREWQPIAQQGNAVAQTWLGYLYEEGHGVGKDETEAVRLYRQAAAQGHADAQNNLALMYEQSRGVVKNETEAVRLYRQAAAQGHADAQYNLGRMYEQGRGVARDETEAVRLFRQAAAQGQVDAQYNLGRMYEQGRGVARDETEAVRLFRQAAAQGQVDAQYNLGRMYEQGTGGVPRDLTEAQRWFTQVAETAKTTSERKKALEARTRVTHQLTVPPSSVSPPVFITSSTPVTAPPSPAPGARTSVRETQDRRALVIGNAAYIDNPLTNPVNDATDVAQLLRRLGFVTTLLVNTEKPTMEQAIDVFTHEAPRGGIGLFFFSGHGIQIEGTNYLVPLGAHFKVSSDVKYRAVATDWVLARMEESGMAVKILILDACRNNPLGRSWTRTLNRGLAVMEAPQGSFVAYATSPGTTASDGVGRNSPFTAHLLREILVPGLPIELVFKAVRVGVQQATNGQQIPWDASSLIGEVVFSR